MHPRALTKVESTRQCCCAQPLDQRAADESAPACSILILESSLNARHENLKPGAYAGSSPARSRRQASTYDARLRIRRPVMVVVVV